MFEKQYVKKAMCKVNNNMTGSADVTCMMKTAKMKTNMKKIKEIFSQKERNLQILGRWKN